MESSNTPHNVSDALQQVLWPTSRLGDAIRTIALPGKQQKAGRNEAGPTEDLPANQLDVWISGTAEQEGMEVQRAFVPVTELSSALHGKTRSLVRIRIGDSNFFLAVIGCSRRLLTVVGPDLRQRRIAIAMLSAAHYESHRSNHEDLTQLLERADVRPLSRARVVRTLEAQQPLSVEPLELWVARSPARGGLLDVLREAGLARGAVTLVVAHTAQSVLYVLSWWLLGRGLLEGTIDRGWLAGWALLLVSLVPFRLLTSRMQSLAAIAAGAVLRRRLLRGALRIDAQQVRQAGVGQFFGLLMEASAVESLGLSGGVIALLALLELLVAAIVLGMSAGILPVAALVLWMMVALWMTSRFVSARRRWTDERLALTDHLLESMLGHQTRSIQQPPERRYRLDDERLHRYVGSGVAMDRWDLRLTALIPRGWLVIGIAMLAPAAVLGLSTGRLAAAAGAMLLAHRALSRLTSGLSELAGAAIAGRLILPLVKAAALRPDPVVPSVAISSGMRQAGSPPIARAEGLTFRHDSGLEPVLRDCTLRIQPGAKMLLEGAAGSGKSTLASILSGLLRPQSGLLLLGGLDRSVLGRAGWASRVTMAPQPRDNYLLSGSLAFNLLIGRGWPATQHDLEEAEEVCRELGLGDLIARMPGGMFQGVGETGWQLSQGEQARVFLARALLTRSELVIFDESFSGLDPENADRAMRCVAARSTTVLVTAHA